MYDSTTFKFVKNIMNILEIKEDYKLGDKEDFIHDVEAAKKYFSPLKD